MATSMFVTNRLTSTNCPITATSAMATMIEIIAIVSGTSAPTVSRRPQQDDHRRRQPELDLAFLQVFLGNRLEVAANRELTGDIHRYP